MSINPICFTHSCVKTLTAVEAEPDASNQHELNGVTQLKAIFGSNKITVPASFSIRGQSDVYAGNLTWYDARLNHPTRSEYRLYFQTNPVMKAASEGDDIIIGCDANGKWHCELIK